jgi:hypothetical protein
MGFCSYDWYVVYLLYVWLISQAERRKNSIENLFVQKGERFFSEKNLLD